LGSILPTHRLLDAASEASKGKAKIGSTLKGIGPTYMDKTGRNGMRVGDLEFNNWKEKYRALANKHLFDEDGATMGRVGNEFGATTGRPRRCGWLDLVALKYAVQINGVTELMMMKADVLSGFKTIKVCTSYKYNGKEINHLPYSIETDNIVPIYTEMNGWKEDLTKLTKAEQLPATLNDYISFLEKELQVPIKIVSVGPDRKQTIHR